MECLFPVLQDQTVSGTRELFSRRCGYCEACRLTYRQSWSARIQLEAQLHEASSFITLTYSDDFLPNPPQLQPDDLQNFMKRLRRNLERGGHGSIRFFACGEYGSRTLRPHYHAVLFGVPATIEAEALVLKSWGKGHIQLRELTPARAAYVAKYVCKDVSGDDPIPEGWQREFARMSNRPGIGAGYVSLMSSAVNKQNAKGFPAVTQLLGGSMMIGPVHYPVPRYMREKLKEQIKLGHRSDLGSMLDRHREHRKKGFDFNRDTRTLRATARSRIRKSSGVL